MDLERLVANIAGELHDLEAARTKVLKRDAYDDAFSQKLSAARKAVRKAVGAMEEHRTEHPHLDAQNAASS